MSRPPPEPNAPPEPEWKTRVRDLSVGAGFGGACGILACSVLAVARASYLVLDPLGAMLSIVISAILTGMFTATFIRARSIDAMPPRVRSRTRGWAVVVDARDAEQRALAALALSRTA